MTTPTSTDTVLNHTEIIRDLPVAFLAYEAVEPYKIIDQNEAHEQVSLTRRADIIGKPFLKAFPDRSKKYKQTGKSAPIESIKRIVKTKTPDSLGEFRWDIVGPKGELIQKYWRSTQYPVFAENSSRVVAIYQLTEDITNEHQTEHTLEQTQKKLIEVLATGQVGTWSLDLKKEVATGGPNLARMFGIDADAAAVGIQLKDFIDRIHTDDRDRVQREIQKAIKTAERYESEYRIVLPEGVVRWVLARGQLRSEDLTGSNVFSGTLVDITDRKRNENILYESEARLQFMADSMPHLVWITRPDGYHEYYNKRWYDYTGTKPGATDGDGWNNIFHVDDRARAWKAWRKSLKSGEPYEIEYRLYHAESDSYRWVIGRAMPHRNDKGEIIRWYGTCTDIDDQKREADRQAFLSEISKQLGASLEMKKLLKKVTQLSVPIISDWCTVDLYSEETGFEQVSVAHSDPSKVSLAKEYRKVNPVRIEDDTAIPRIIKSGKPEFYPAITADMIKQHIKNPTQRKFMLSLNLSSMMLIPLRFGKKTMGVITFVAANSGRHFTEADFSMACDMADRLSLSMTNAQLYETSRLDVKRRRELERQLRSEKQTLESRVKERTQQLQLTNQGLRDEIVRRQSAESELTRSNKELEDFAYVASHDLQEPLRKIQAFGNLLLAEYGDSLGLEGADFLKRMHSAAGRMSTLIDDLLTFSRVGRNSRATHDVNLNEVLQDVVADLETRISETEGKVKIGKLPTICGDTTHFRQVFQNLVGNAIKFHRPNVPPVVTVSAKKKGKGYEIRVEDNGIGFDEKYLDRIFAVFQRLHERSNYEGTGIGLAVCRKIVEQYGGTITATSKKQQGSTFIIWLPTKEEKA